MRRYLVISFLVVGLLFGSGQFKIEATINIDEFSQLVDDYRKKYRVPGVAIGLIEDGKIVMVKGFGYREKKKDSLVKPDTIFQVASMSKPVAALGVINLICQGQVELEVPVEEYLTSWQLPESEFDSKGVTIERLLSHYAGLGPSGYPGYYPNGDLPTLEDALQGGVRGTRKVTFNKKPGIEFSYAGGGYTVLQLMIEEVSGRDFSVYMKDEILTPLQMNDSFFSYPDKEIYKQLARAHSIYGEELPHFLFVEKAAAGLYSTALDYCRFIEANIKGFRGKGIFPQEIFKKMYTKVNEQYGLGWSIVDLKNKERIIAHGGANYGWKSYTAFIPERGDGIVILTNSDRGMPFYREVANNWYEIQNIEYRTESPGMFTVFLLDLYQRIVRFLY